MESIKELTLIAPVASILIAILLQVIKPLLGEGKKFLPAVSIVV